MASSKTAQTRKPKYVLPNVFTNMFNLSMSAGVLELLRQYYIVLNYQLIDRGAHTTSHNKIATGIITKHLLEHADWITKEYALVCKKIYGEGCEELIRSFDGGTPSFAAVATQPKGLKDKRALLVHIFKKGRSLFLGGLATSDFRRSTAASGKVRARGRRSTTRTNLRGQERRHAAPGGDGSTQPFGTGPEPELLRRAREYLQASLNREAKDGDPSGSSGPKST